MFRFMMQKLIHKKWMVVCLLIGNILLMAIACSNPMYKSASLQRMITKQFSDYIATEGKYPAYVMLESSITARDKGAELYVHMDKMAGEITKRFGLKGTDSVQYITTAKSSAFSTMQREDNMGSRSLRISTLSGIEDHVNIISGRMYSNEKVDGVYEAIVSQSMFFKYNYILDETVEFKGSKGVDGKPLRVKFVGVFTNSEQKDSYWINSPSDYKEQCFIAFDLFNKDFVNTEKPTVEIESLWYEFFDYSKIIPSEVDKVVKLTELYSGEYNKKNSRISGEQYLPILKDFKLSEKKSITTLLVLQVPVLVLLCAFIFMISRQMLDLEQNEIALLKSRGSSKKQIIMIYLLQSFILTVLSAVVGVPLGMFMCMVLGSANGFLEFVHRSSLNIIFDMQVVWFGLAAMAVSIGVMVLPVIIDSNVSIVSIKHKKNRKSKSLWQRMYLDVILLIASLYGLYSLNDRKDILISNMLEGEGMDPMLCLVASLFIISGGLVALRIQPVLVKIVYLIGKKKWNPAMFASFLNILRTGAKQKFMMVFLILTVALGIYNATFARTILSNANNSIEYSHGADVVLQEVWKDNSLYIEGLKLMSTTVTDGEMPEIPELTYTEPDYSRFYDIEGVESVARVHKESVNVEKKVRDADDVTATIMGINTKEYGETINFDDTLLPEHINTYLNVLSTKADAVLLSQNFHTKQRFNVGDPIEYINEDGIVVNSIVYGFVEYWPSYSPESYVVNEEGVTDKQENYLIISNLARTQEELGLKPYEVWLKVNGSTQPIYDYAEETKLQFTMFKDAKAEKINISNDTLFQGTNGILTMSFIVVLILCCVGFLIYWILSIRQRELLFGVFRAMGMRKGEVIGMLINEQVFSTGISVGIGALLGILASNLYVPIVQICYSATEQVIPLVVVKKQLDMIRLFGVVGAVICICMVILGVLISKINISQALKLGED